MKKQIDGEKSSGDIEDGEEDAQQMPEPTPEPTPEPQPQKHSIDINVNKK